MKTSDRFKADATYGVEGPTVRLIADLQDRLYSERRMSGDEMRDWANALHAHLHDRFIEIDPTQYAPGNLEAALAAPKGTDLPVYSVGDDDQPTTCSQCGRRTQWEDLPDQRQLHTCECGYRFILDCADTETGF